MHGDKDCRIKNGAGWDGRACTGGASAGPGGLGRGRSTDSLRTVTLPIVGSQEGRALLPSSVTRSLG